MIDKNHRNSYRRSTSINNLIPPSMSTNLPSLSRYYSLNRRADLNNLDLVSQNNRQNLYCTMGHQRPHHNVRLIVPPGSEQTETINMFPRGGQEGEGREGREPTYNVSSTSDYNTISVTEPSDGSSDQQALIRDSLPVSLASLSRRLESWLGSALFLVTVISPLVMISLPNMDLLPLKLSQLQCGVGCEGMKISIIFKLLLLSLACWALLSTNCGGSLPRVRLIRSGLVCLLVLILSLFWTVYSLQLTEHHRARLQYESLVWLASSLVTCLLYLNYLTLLLLLLTPGLSSGLVIHVIRAEDGASRYFNIGSVSLQEAAREVVSSYYRSFSPALLQAERSNKHRTNLITATEESFARLENHQADTAKDWSCSPTLPYPDQDISTGSQPSAQEVHQVAQAIFPSIYKHLLKYLKSSRKSSQHTMDSIMTHLVTYIKYGMSPQAFLSLYFSPSSVIEVRRRTMTARTQETVSNIFPLQTVPQDGEVEWLVESEESLLREVREGQVLRLLHGRTVLHCRVKAAPALEISSLSYRDTISPSFVWEGDRESPV